jgi:hypothetical protein
MTITMVHQFISTTTNAEIKVDTDETIRVTDVTIRSSVTPTHDVILATDTQFTYYAAVVIAVTIIGDMLPRPSRLETRTITVLVSARIISLIGRKGSL